MVSEIIAAVAVIGALVGASANAFRSWWQAPESEGWSWKRFAGGLLAGGMTALALINFSSLEQLATEGMIALFVSNMLLGAGASTLFSQTHKTTEVKP